MHSELADKLKEYTSSGYYPLHMPGHKRIAGGYISNELAQVDYTEIPFSDNLHEADGIIKEAQCFAAACRGADEAHFLVGGSTAGILSAISSCVPHSGSLLIARNAHKSAYNAMYLREIHPVFIYPSTNTEFGFCEPVSLKAVKEALEGNHNISAVFLVSPTYEGRIAELQNIISFVHSKGVPIIVDAAHGAHLGWGMESVSASEMGADIVIESVHKTLPALTQSAILYVSGDLVDREKLSRFLAIYQTSSPSYILMESIDYSIRLMNEDGASLISQLRDNCERLERDLSDCSYVTICHMDGLVQDYGKVVIKIDGKSGEWLLRQLHDRFKLDLEMATPDYALAMFTVCDSTEGFNRLIDALRILDLELCESGASHGERAAYAGVTWREEKKNIRANSFSVMDEEGVWVPVSDSIGRTVLDFVIPYPPGYPLLAPGETMTDSEYSYIIRLLKEGLTVCGLQRDEDDSGQTVNYLIRVQGDI